MNRARGNDYKKNLQALFHHLPFGYVILAIVVSTVAAMAGHELVTQFLQRPQPVLNQNPEQNFFWAIFLIHAIKAFATMLLYTLISQHWRLKKFVVRTFAFALLLAVINENFLRRFLMETIADNRNMAWEFLLVAVPSWISYITVAGTVVMLFSLQTKSLWKYAVAFGLVLLEYQYVESVTRSVLEAFFHLNPGGQYTQGAYDLQIIIASYITYLVPVTGMFITWLWIRKSFPETSGIKALLFFFLLVGVHGQLLGILQIAMSEGNIFYRILYYGSFWWELLIVAFSIVYFVERKQAK